MSKFAKILILGVVVMVAGCATPNSSPIIRKRITCTAGDKKIVTPWTYYVPMNVNGRVIHLRLPMPDQE